MEIRQVAIRRIFLVLAESDERNDNKGDGRAGGACLDGSCPPRSCGKQVHEALASAGACD